MNAPFSPSPAPRPAPLRWTLVIPCAARLQPGTPTRPKYLLTMPNGHLLARRAAASMPADRVSEIVVAILRDADERYQASEAVRRAFDGAVRCVVLDEPTEGPAHTVRETIERAVITGPVAIKDADSFFSIDSLPDTSFMAVSDLRKVAKLSDPARKSYVRLNEQGVISDVVEKSVSSNFISVGLYGFNDSAVFTATFDRIAGQIGHKRLFVSHIVANAIFHSHVFLPCMAEDWVDIGTQADWNDHRINYATIVLDIDGVIFRNQSGFFEPLWGTPVEPIAENVRHVRALQQRGAQLVFMTSRPESYRSETIAALEGQGLRVHALVMGCNHAARVLVNDYAQSNGYPSAIAVNVERNKPQLPHLLLADLPTRDQTI